MPDCCLTCNSPITRTSPGIFCGICKKPYHYKCVKLPVALQDLSEDSGVTWACSYCKKNVKQGNSEIDRHWDSLSVVRDEVKKIAETQKQIFDSLNFYGGKIDDFGVRLEGFQRAVNSFAELKSEVDELKNECKLLKSEIELIHQYNRRNNVEVFGIPENRDEDVKSTLRKIGDIVRFPLQDTDIIECHRVQSHPNSTNRGNPRNIVVKLAAHDLKLKFMESVKVARSKLTADALGFSVKHQIYVNDHLTHQNKWLLRQCKEFCKVNQYKYCWIKESKIFVKKTDSSRTVNIVNEDGLRKLPIT